MALQFSMILVVLLQLLIQLVDQSTPTAYHTSALTGEAWVLELMTGHPDRIRCELGVSADVFAALVAYLQEIGIRRSKYVSLEEQVAIFLYMAVTGLTVRHVGERFQRSNDTISRYVLNVPRHRSRSQSDRMYRYFKRMLHIFSSPPFYDQWIRLPGADEPVDPRISTNSKLRFFKDALGAIDGSHIHLSAPMAQRGPFRNRKGFVSQNCLFLCTFGLKFVYALTGWEGSATDARMWEEALRAGGLTIPVGRYYLADAGFPSCSFLMIPYRSIRYHLAEWGRAAQRLVACLFLNARC